MPLRAQPRYPVEDILTVLHETHDLSAYEAVERLVYSAESAGLNADALLAMINKATPFEKVLDLIVSKAKCSQKVA